MFDIKWIRDNPKEFDAGLAKRDLEAKAQTLIDLDTERREHVAQLQDMQNRRNAASKEIGRAKGADDEQKAKTLMGEIAGLKADIQTGEERERSLDAGIEAALSTIPNLPHDDVPEGMDETENQELRREGDIKRFDFEPKQHFELGEQLGLMDFVLSCRQRPAPVPTGEHKK